MISKKSIFIAALSLSLFAAGESNAAFPVKKAAVQTEIVTQSAQAENAISVVTNENELSATNEVSHVAVKKHSFFSRVANKISTVAKKAAISQAAYIILSIFWLGWLAIGLNDNFNGAHWLIALLLYILFWLPGFIYSLIVMGDYY